MAFQLSTEYEALKHDVKMLFSRFYEKQSVRFEDFASEWKALNFSCIFAATYRNTLNAKMRIVERLFRVASEFLSEESTFLYRVATVYMFYAVYFKQICDPKVRIRMTPTMWKDLMDFLDIVIEHQHLDVAYVIQYLRKHGAFVFTAFPKQLMFGRNEFMLGIEGINTLRHTFEADKYVNELIDTGDVLESLKTIQQEYSEVKQRVLDESKEDERESLLKVLFYSGSDFPNEFHDIVDSHKNRHREGLSFKPDMSDTTQRPVLSQLQELKTEQEEADEDEDGGIEGERTDSRATKMSKLKQKSWSLSVSKSPRKCRNDNIVASETEVSDDTISGEVLLYKRSAMLEPFKVKYVKRSLSSRGMRYKVGQNNAES